MQRRPEVADAWFERAVAATPDPSSVPSSPFNALSDLAAFDFEEAVYWIEAARHLEPDSEYVHKLRASVEVDTFFGRMKFASAQSKAKRRGFPGQDDAGL